jgi:Bifunctional DNA primase/polymerase, N-terminal
MKSGPTVFAMTLAIPGQHATRGQPPPRARPEGAVYRIDSGRHGHGRACVRQSLPGRPRQARPQASRASVMSAKRALTRTGPFSNAAPDLCQRGVAVIPLGGADGKVPLVEWQRWRRPPGRKAIAELAAKFPNANIGVLTGLSGVTIVDVDEPDLVDDMVRSFGTTPLITGTPRGGSHLWYRSAGERSMDLRASEDLAVDIKAAGGLVAVPPSFAWGGPGMGRPYAFVAGSWADLATLPKVYPGSLPTIQPKGATVRTLRAVRYGLRNTTLLKLLLREVRHCDTEADLLDVATTIVQQHFELHDVPSFPDAEIAKTVRSAWEMEQEDRNWVGKGARIVTTASEFVVLQRNPDAYVFWHALRWAHCADPEPFALSCKAMAHEQSIDGWADWKRYARARDWLLAHGGLVQTHTGGKGRGDPHLYRLASPANRDTEDGSFMGTGDVLAERAEKGPEKGPNIRRHPAPLDGAADAGPSVGSAGASTTLARGTRARARRMQKNSRAGSKG